MQLNINKIKEKLSKRKAQPVDIDRHYSVALPIIYNEATDNWEIVYEVRSINVSQPSEISFPGGAVEDGESYENAAVRETCEELLIDESNIEVLGEMDYLVTTGVLTIRCFLIQIKGIQAHEIRPNTEEVDRIFTVPLQFFLENEPLESVLTMSVDEDEHFPYDLIPNGKEYNFAKAKNIILFYKYKGYVIWGFTAKMTQSSLNILKKLELLPSKD